MQLKPCFAVLLIAALAVTATAQAESVGVLLQKGVYQEETVGDLDAAMKIYQQIVADEKANPWGQNTQPTSKLLENPEFTRASRMNLGRRSVSR